MDEPKFTVHTFPMLDTGIGQEMGYASDREFMEAARAERDAMPKEQRELLDRVDAEMDRRFLYGD